MPVGVVEVAAGVVVVVVEVGLAVLVVVEVGAVVVVVVVLLVVVVVVELVDEPELQAGSTSNRIKMMITGMNHFFIAFLLLFL